MVWSSSANERTPSSERQGLSLLVQRRGHGRAEDARFETGVRAPGSSAKP
jgi:hypothetical protein